ncbi:MAG: ASCH domain-containing protein [Phycisphaerales bacterium]
MPRTRTVNPSQAKHEPKSLLISLHPRFANAIFGGTKQAELRKVRPQVESGDQVVIYCTKPTAAILGVVTVESVIAAPPSKLWTRLSQTSAVSRSEFFRYFHNRHVAYAILITSPRLLKTPITLAELRTECRGFIPPQSYWYLQKKRLRDRRVMNLITQSQFANQRSKAA